MTRHALLSALLFAFALPALADDAADMQAAYRRGNQLLREGKTDEAEKEFLRSLDLGIGLYGEKNMAPATALDALGRLYLNTGRASKAADYHGRSLKVREALVPGTVDEAIAQSGLGLALKDLGKFAEAETHLTRAWELRKKLQPNDVGEAQEATNLGTLYRELGRYPEAEKLQKSAFDIMQKKLPADHPYLGMVQNNLANVYLNQGKYDEALTLFKEVLAKLQKAEEVSPLDIGGIFQNLSIVSRLHGRYTEAERYTQEAIKVFDKLPGNKAVPLSNALTSLGNLHADRSRFASAESAHRKAHELRKEALPKGHPLIADSLNNLAYVHSARGQFQEAQALYQEVLDMRIAAFKTEVHAQVAAVLNNLATTREQLGERKQAQEHYERAIRIQKALNPRSVEYGNSIHNLAELHDKAGDFTQAEAGYRDAIAIFEKALPKDHPHIGESYHNLATVLISLGKKDEAREALRLERAIAEKAHGKDHPAVANSLFSLALLSWSEGKPADAATHFDAQRRALRHYYLRELPFLSASAQKTFLEHEEANSLGAALHLARESKDATIVRRSAEWLLNTKAIALEARTLRARLDRDLTEPEATKTLAEIQNLRSRESALALRETGAAADAVRKQRHSLAAERARLERALMDVAGPAGGLFRSWIDLDDVRKAMPKDSLLVEIAHIPALRGKPGDARYVAWVIPSSSDVTIIDLGEAAGIDAAVKSAREAIARGAARIKEIGEPKAEAEARDVLDTLAKRILHPLARHLKGVKQLILSPDGDLWLAPWAALPLNDNKYLVEALVPRFVVSGRDLLAPIAGLEMKTSTPLVLADPDFDAAPTPGTLSISGKIAAGRLADFDARFQFAIGGTLIVRFPSGEVIGKGTWTQNGADVRMETDSSVYTGKLDGVELKGERRFKEMNAAPDSFNVSFAIDDGLPAGGPGILGAARRLEWTGAEGDAAAKGLKRIVDGEPRLLTDQRATEGAVKSTARPRMLVVASHGFFLPSKSRTDDPLIRCGLLLAGCNQRGKIDAGQDDGVLTGHEVAGLDLRGTELIILSACDTAVGVPNTGDGVAGLRQAFHLAGGARVVASLWQVPDPETAALMTRFYATLATGKSSAESLAIAQREAAIARRKTNAAAHPFFWAAFTVSGR